MQREEHATETQSAFIRWFSEPGLADVPLVGGKNASLGEMFGAQGQVGQGLRVPNGFAVTAAAYKATLDRADAWGALHAEYGESLTVAVRSSATAEDLPTASFAGQHESYLNITGPALLDSVRRCVASLFTGRAIVYRIENGFDHFKVWLSVGVMKMVRADLGASGVIFTLDTETGFRGVVLVTCAWGLGENVVQGTVDPDEFTVFKPSLRSGRRTLLRRSLGTKQVRMVYGAGNGGPATRNEATSGRSVRAFRLEDDAVPDPATAALRIEEHYGRQAGHALPMDIEWARDGIDGQRYLVQARPETVASRRSATELDGILVAPTTMPDWGTVMKTAAAVVTDHGGRTCHAASWRARSACRPWSAAATRPPRSAAATR